MRVHSVAVIAVLTFLLASHVCADPVVFWASDPVRPDGAVLTTGSGFGDTPTVEMTRLAESEIGVPPAIAFAWPGNEMKVETFQAADRSVKFIVPSTYSPGVFAYRITGPAGKTLGLLNRPVIWWTQGDLGTATSPGGSLRVFGKNLGWDGKKTHKTMVLLRGPQEVLLPGIADCYEATVVLPQTLPVGEYQAFVHNGCGGRAAWSDPIRICVEKAKDWPKTVFDVRQFGGVGDGGKDDMGAVQAALAAAKKNGGGVVYFPRGRYLVTGMLTIPRFTVLRGEKREWVNILWPDMPKPPETLIRGTNSFGCEEITFYCNNYKTFLTSDVEGKDAGNVFLRRLRVRANVYRGHKTKPEEVDRRYRKAVTADFGAYYLVVSGGRNVEVTDCDLSSSGCVINLMRPQGARIERNIIGIGRWGSSLVFGGDGLIIADNQYVGNDLQSWGAAGGLGFGNLRHVCIRRNSFSQEYGGDREPITSDASGSLYCGVPTTSDPTSITLALPETPNDAAVRTYVGGAIYVVAGKGEGQWRRIFRFEGSTIIVDRTWDVIPDASSTVVVTHNLDQWLILDNDFSDTGMAVQFYGAALEHIVAGNRSSRTVGYHNFGANYYGPQPNWYVQWLDNQILEGNSYDADHDSHRLSGDAHIGVYGRVYGRIAPKNSLSPHGWHDSSP